MMTSETLVIITLVRYSPRWGTAYSPPQKSVLCVSSAEDWREKEREGERQRERDAS
jgi:hypothetical protein